MVAGVSGRTPTLITDADLEQLGKDLTIALQEHTEWLFMQEISAYIFIPLSEFKALSDRTVFRSYYEMFRNTLAVRIAKTAGTFDENKKPIGLHPSIAQRFICTYFTDVLETEKELKRVEAPNNTITINLKRPYDETTLDDGSIDTLSIPMSSLSDPRLEGPG